MRKQVLSSILVFGLCFTSTVLVSCSSQDAGSAASSVSSTEASIAENTQESSKEETETIIIEETQSEEADNEETEEETTEETVHESVALSYEGINEYYTSIASNSSLTKYYDYTYPIFAGDGSDILNQYIAQRWLQNKPEGDMTDGDVILRDFGGMDLSSVLPFYDIVAVNVSYVSDTYVAFYTVSNEWNGKVQAYSSVEGGIVNLITGEEVSYINLIPVEINIDDLILMYNAGIVNYCYGGGVADSAESYTLTGNGLAFTYLIRETGDRVQVTIPWENLNMSDGVFTEVNNAATTFYCNLSAYKETLANLCGWIPNFERNNLDATFWSDFIYYAYTTGSTESEMVFRDGTTVQKVSYDAVSECAKTILGVELPKAETLQLSAGVEYEDGYFYVSQSDSAAVSYVLQRVTVIGENELQITYAVLDVLGSQCAAAVLTVSPDAESANGFVVTSQNTTYLGVADVPAE